MHFFIIFHFCYFYFFCFFIDYGQHTNEVSRLLAASMFLSIQHELFHLFGDRSGYKVDFRNPHFVSHILCGCQLLLIHIDVIQPPGQHIHIDLQ